MATDWQRLCGIPSNCRACRQNPEHRRAVGWPDVCPRGMTAFMTQGLPQHIGPIEDCRSFVGVLQTIPCCGGRTRPSVIECRDAHVLTQFPAGKVPARTCHTNCKWREART